MTRSPKMIALMLVLLPAGLKAEVPDFNPKAFSVHGAETLGMGAFGFELGYGVPNVEFDATVGVFEVGNLGAGFSPAMDLTAYIRSAYLLSTEVGGTMRLRLFKVKSEGARHAVALTFGGGYVLEQTVSPVDDQVASYRAYEVQQDGTSLLAEQKVAYRSEKDFAWPYDYRESTKFSLGLLYSIRGGGNTGFFQVGVDYWMPPDLEVLGKLDETTGDLPGFVLDRDPFWVPKFTAGIEFNLSINVNFFLAATVMYAKDPNSGDGLPVQKMNGKNPAMKEVGVYDPFTGTNKKVPVVAYEKEGDKVSGQIMAGLLLFFN